MKMNFHSIGFRRCILVLKIFSLVSLLSAAFQPAIAAPPLTGEALFLECSESAQANQRQRCEDYIVGVADGITTLEISYHLLHPDSQTIPPIFCVPSDSPTKLVDAVVVFLKKNPESRHFGASSQVILALQNEFPCAISK